MDYNATTPIFPEVCEEMQPYLTEHFGNPSSVHIFSQECKDSIQRARVAVKELMGADRDEEVVFTSCGSESNCLAINIGLEAYFSHHPNKSQVDPPHIIASSIEHPSVLNHLSHLENNQTISLSIISVNERGVVSVESVKREIEVLKPSNQFLLVDRITGRTWLW